MSQPLLQVKELHTHFNMPKAGLWPLSKPVTLRAVNGVSFSIEKGEVLALVGESGCGKSTIGRTLTQLEEATSGSALFEGQDILSLTRAEFRPLRRAIQMVFQDPFASLNPRMKIGEILAEPLHVHGLVSSPAEASRRVAELLQQVGLDPQVVSKYPYEFSGGQRQRIGIARVMILAPKLVIADEPVSALDVSVQAQVLNLLKKMQGDTGFSMLFISHDLGVVRHVAHRVAVMYLGQVVELAPTEEIFNKPNHPYTRLLLDSIPRINQAQYSSAPTKQAEPLSPMQVHPGCSFVNRCSYAQPQCQNKPPKLVELSESHQSRCHLASELLLETVS